MESWVYRKEEDSLTLAGVKKFWTDPKEPVPVSDSDYATASSTPHAINNFPPKASVFKRNALMTDPKYIEAYTIKRVTETGTGNPS